MEFLDPNQFPFTATLGREWQVVRDEVDGLPADRFTPWIENASYTGDGWRVVPLIAPPFPDWEEHCAANREYCPRTVELFKPIPGFWGACVSVLEPGTEIHPHRGDDVGVLRFHLGLRCPAAYCSIRVQDQERSWKDGEWLVFDDTNLHAAWNLSGERRVVLLIDVKKKGLREVGLL